MILLLFALVCLGLLLTLYANAFKGRFFKRHHLLVDLDIETVNEHLQDLNSWTNWLPWLLFEKQAQIELEYANPLSPLPSCLVWRGDLIKQGSLSLEAARPNALYYHTLVAAPAFYPCDFHFNLDLTKQKHGTLISFQVTGELPFLKRWQQADYAIRADKDAELAMLLLNADLQTKVVQDADEMEPFEFLAQTRLDNLDAVTRPFTVNHQPMSQKMDQGFHDLMTTLGPENPPAGPSFALYRQVDLANHVFTGRLGIPVQNMAPCELCPERIVLPGNYLALRYTGRYQHLSVAWHVLYQFMRLRKLKPHRHREGIEIFEVGPAHAEQPKNYVTRICLPIKTLA